MLYKRRYTDKRNERCLAISRNQRYIKIEAPSAEESSSIASQQTLSHSELKAPNTTPATSPLAIMRLGSIIVAGLAAVASAIPAKEVVENINTITMKSRDLQVPAKSVSVRDAALIAIGQGNYPVTHYPNTFMPSFD